MCGHVVGVLMDRQVIHLLLQKHKVFKLVNNQQDVLKMLVPSGWHFQIVTYSTLKVDEIVWAWTTVVSLKFTKCPYLQGSRRTGEQGTFDLVQLPSDVKIKKVAAKSDSCLALSSKKSNDQSCLAQRRILKSANTAI